mgnify:CR=1 FL=1
MINKLEVNIRDREGEVQQKGVRKALFTDKMVK